MKQKNKRIKFHKKKSRVIKSIIIYATRKRIMDRKIKYISYVLSNIKRSLVSTWYLHNCYRWDLFSSDYQVVSQIISTCVGTRLKFLFARSIQYLLNWILITCIVIFLLDAPTIRLGGSTGSTESFESLANP